MKIVPTYPVLAALAFATIAGLAPAHAQTPQPVPRPVAPVVWEGETQESLLFHVTLVAASRQGESGGRESLPKGVAKALDDIRDFLPYQGYRVIDTALVRANREVHARLAGPDGEPLEAAFVFRKARGGDGSAESYLVERFRLDRPPEAEGLARTAVEDRAGRRAPAPPAPALDASFRIDRGETVVVGSSRLDGGDGALIVLLTAVPRAVPTTP